MHNSVAAIAARINTTLRKHVIVQIFGRLSCYIHTTGEAIWLTIFIRGRSGFYRLRPLVPRVKASEEGSTIPCRNMEQNMHRGLQSYSSYLRLSH